MPCSAVQSCSTLCSPVDYSPLAPLSMEFSRQEYWSRLPFPPPGNLPDSGIKPACPALAGGSITTTTTWEGGIFITSPLWSFSSIQLWTYCCYNERKRCKKLSFRKIKGTKCSHYIGEWFMVQLSQQNRMAILQDTTAQDNILKNERPFCPLT